MERDRERLRETKRDRENGWTVEQVLFNGIAYNQYGLGNPTMAISMLEKLKPQ